MPRRTDSFLLRGGLDLVTSPLAVEPGRLWTGANYEPVEAGYRRLRGFERKDGRPAPSEATYSILNFDGASAVPDDGDQITGQTSGATAYVVADPVIQSGAVADGDAAGYYVVSDIDGTFEDDEALDSSQGTVNGLPVELGAETIALDLAYRDAAAARRRALIEAVPGSGQVRGVWVYGDTLYAVRDNAGATAGVMHKETSSGWAVVSLGHSLAFDAGANDPTTVLGGTITGATSGATAKLGYLVEESGTWAGNDVVGAMWLHEVSGTFQDNENLRMSIDGSTVTVARANGTSTANALPAGGRYEFLNHNFLGQAASRRMYGVNGAGKAFHFDGSQFVSISTGQPDDEPTHIGVQHNHLLLSYPGGSLIGSETGSPDGYNATKGAFEIAAGQDILGMVGGLGLGNTLSVGADRMQVLYGKDSSDFELIDQSAEQTGGVEWTAQSVGGPLYMDNRGVRSVTTTQAYGNFVIGTMTADVQPWLDRQRDEKNVPISSMRVRSSDQYRVFFESGLGLIVYLGRGRPELSLIDYGVPVRCAVSAEDSDRIERVYFGSDDGWVYEAERGRSFDGEEIQAYARMPLNHGGAPARQKRYFGADLHLDLDSAITLEVSALFDDGSAPDALADEQTLYGGGGLWEEALFDEFYFNSPLNGYGSFDLDGIGRNVSILVASRTDREAPHTLNGVTLHWSPRRAER